MEEINCFVVFPHYCIHASKYKSRIWESKKMCPYYPSIIGLHGLLQGFCDQLAPSIHAFFRQSGGSKSRCDIKTLLSEISCI
jgi:hypothetical protein